jgi:hypothetical protein
MKYLIGGLLILFSFVGFGFIMSKKIAFKQNVSGYLKRAGDANTIKLAEVELTKVIDYLEANELTSGYTSILWETPDEDIGFWYENLKASQQELQNLNSDSALERTNVLMKLRETLLDTGKSTRVTIPKGLSWYPKNVLYGSILLGSFIALMAGCVVMIPKQGTEEQEAGVKK